MQQAQKPFQRLGLIGKFRQTVASQLVTDIAQFLAQGYELWVESQTAALMTALPAGVHTVQLEQMHAQVDCAVIVGGDGTMLWAARALAPHHIPMIGVNQGTLGFMTDVSAVSTQAWQAQLSKLLAGHYREESRAMLLGEVVRQGQAPQGGVALNDAVISRASTSMIDVVVKIDGVLAYRVRADALVVATPTGSTAYALSANGPILHPQLGGFVIVPVAPQTLSHRPITVADSAVIEITLAAGRQAQASFDMQTFADLNAGDVLRLAKAPFAARLLHPLHYDYYHTLRQKLHWSHNPIL